MKKVLIMVLLTLLFGCEEKEASKLQVNEKVVVESALVEEETPLTEEEMLAIENDKINDDLIKSIYNLETELNKLYELKITYDEYVESIQGIMGNETYHSHLNHLLFLGNMSLVVENSEGLSAHDKIKSTTGMSLDKIQEVYRPLIDAYYEKYFRGYVYEDLQISEVYDDGYFRYVYSKRPLWVDGGDYFVSWEIEGEIHDFTRYNLYVLIKSEGKYIISDIESMLYFDFSKLPKVGNEESLEKYYDKLIQKHMYFKDEEVIFKPYTE